MRIARLGGVGVLMFGLPSGPAQAECLGSCADGLVGALVAMLVYGTLGLVVLVMLIREKWRRGGVRLLGGTVLVAVGLPLASQGWLAWKLRGMESLEITGTLPDLTGKTPLLISDSITACYYDACGLLLAGRGEAGTVAVPISALAGLDPSQPIDLAQLPLELWQPPSTGSSEATARQLTNDERRAAAAKIDYLILLGNPWYSDEPGPIEAALRLRTGMDGLGASERASIALGPVSDGKLELATMSLDLLDLWLADEALALILAPYNTQDPGNEIAGRDGVEDLLCTEAALKQGWDCDYALQ